MGAALTQHPESMRAVVSEVGIYDSLRWEGRQRGIQRHGVRQHEGPGPIQGDVRLFAVAARAGRRQVPGRPVHNRGQRRARRAVRIAQDDGTIAGGHRVGPARVVAHGSRRGTWLPAPRCHCESRKPPTLTLPRRSTRHPGTGEVAMRDDRAVLGAAERKRHGLMEQHRA